MDKYDFFYPSGLIIKNDIEICIQKENKKILYDSDILRFVFKGDRFEEINLEQLKHHKTSFWDKWPGLAYSWGRYSNIIHPVMRSTVLNLLNSEERKTEPLILEIGGGTGRLAKSILEEYGKPADYVLLEYNKTSVNRAKYALGKTKAVVVRTDITKDKEFYQDEKKANSIKENSVDIALGSGILTKSVLKNKRGAMKALQKIYFCLKPNGYLVLSGHTSSILDSSDFKAAGFEVLNTKLPRSSLQLYILRKI